MYEVKFIYLNSVKKKTESIDKKFIGELLRKYLDELI